MIDCFVLFREIGDDFLAMGIKGGAVGREAGLALHQLFGLRAKLGEALFAGRRIVTSTSSAATDSKASSEPVISISPDI